MLTLGLVFIRNNPVRRPRYAVPARSVCLYYVTCFLPARCGCRPVVVVVVVCREKGRDGVLQRAGAGGDGRFGGRGDGLEGLVAGRGGCRKGLFLCF